MQNPYNQYQVNQNSLSPKKKKRRAKSSKEKKKPLKKEKLNWPLVSLSFFGFILSFYLFTHADQMMSTINKIEVGFNQSIAQDKTPPIKNNAEEKTDSSLPVGKASQFQSSSSETATRDASVYQALKDKQKEIEKKERYLVKLEEKLEKQRLEIKNQLQEMEKMRLHISSKLDKKMTLDEKSIDKLVGVYSNMKPANAALVMSQLDEGLAIQLLGKMKKQNAAAILNYVKPEKAQYLSERFTGLKK